MTSEKPAKTRREKPSRKKPHAAPKEAAQDTAVGERIAKRLARAGVASRRDAEALIAEGRVQVNGKLLDSPAFNVKPSDRIEVDGKPLPAIERTRLFLFHKPTGVVTTSRDPEGRRTVFDVLPHGLPRLVTVGRLDINTEGLLVLTNDGGLARALELPATGWMRRYRVRVHGKVDPKALEELKNGIAVDGVFYGAIEASLDREQGSNAWLMVGLREGKNREVKNVLGALGLDVTRLIRVSYGPFQLGALAEGEVQEIKGRTLREQLGERLIAEAGANFDAPITTPFSNKPVRAERGRPADEAGDRKREQRGEGRAKSHRRDREDKREEMRGRLQTRPGAPREDREGRDGNVRHNRAAHVWMAPGARPQGKRKSEASEEKNPRPAGRDRRGTDAKGTPRQGGDRERSERFAKDAKRQPAAGFGKGRSHAKDDMARASRPPSKEKPFGAKPASKPGGKPAGAKYGGKPGGGKAGGKPVRSGKGHPPSGRPGKAGKGR